MKTVIYRLKSNVIDLTDTALQNVARMIVHTVSPPSWSRLGGPGELSAHVIKKKDNFNMYLIAAWQSDEVHSLIVAAFKPLGIEIDL